MAQKTLQQRQLEARLERARAMRNIADVNRLRQTWAAEEHAKTNAGIYEAEMRKAEREFGPMVRKWSAEIEEINRRYWDQSYTAEDFIKDQLDSASEGFHPGTNGDYWKR